MVDSYGLNDQEKLDEIKSVLGQAVDGDSLTEWEIKFIEEQNIKSAITDREFSEKESKKIDEIYEKLYKEDYL